MIALLSVWLLVVGFLGAGLFNAVGTPATQRGFVRWGYPAWWGRVTGGLEIVAALLLALPASRCVGLMLGTAIIAAATLTVVRHREFAHLMPLGMFAGLLALVTTLS